MTRASLDELYKTTREQRLRRCEKCGGQPWTLCFWWHTPDGPSGCSEDGNIYTCGVAAWQKDMHEFRAWRGAHVAVAEGIAAFFGDGSDKEQAE